MVAVDFDGCLVTNAWPEVGAKNTQLFEILINFRKEGGKLILWTCREKALLLEAVAFCAAEGLKFDAVNESLPEWIAKYGSDCRKIGADFYLDDRAVRVAAEDI